MTPEVECPNCGGYVADLDGFGVLMHEECGYCSHPSATGGVCDNCGWRVGHESAEGRATEGLRHCNPEQP